MPYIFNGNGRMNFSSRTKRKSFKRNLYKSLFAILLYYTNVIRSYVHDNNNVQHKTLYILHTYFIYMPQSKYFPKKAFNFDLNVLFQFRFNMIYVCITQFYSEGIQFMLTMKYVLKFKSLTLREPKELYLFTIIKTKLFNGCDNWVLCVGKGTFQAGLTPSN